VSAAQLNLFGPATEEMPRIASYPRRPGFKASGASEEAARHVAGGAARLRAQVLLELNRGSGTADEIAVRMRRSPLSVRPRMSELRALGLITATDERRRNDSGMTATVWKAGAK
jgi:hypothetical protein